jgi:phosphate transport system substrate-binding protein
LKISEYPSRINLDKKIVVTSIVAIIVFSMVGAFLFSDAEGAQLDAVMIDGVEPTEVDVLSGSYPIQRNLIICTMGEPTGNIKCFIDWITSDEGQEIVSKEFVPLPESERTTYDTPSSDGVQNFNVGGSTSIQATMMMLAEAYKEKFGINISVSGGGSGVGASNTIQGQFGIGMCSRDLKSSELEQGLIPTSIGNDGVAVIVNGAGVDGLTLEQLSKIYSGEITNWKEVGGVDKSIAVIARDDASGTRECFDKMMGPDWIMKTDVVKYNSSGGVIGAVRIASGSIGYISIGQLKSI